MRCSNQLSYTGASGIEEIVRISQNPSIGQEYRYQWPMLLLLVFQCYPQITYRYSTSIISQNRRKIHKISYSTSILWTYSFFKVSRILWTYSSSKIEIFPKENQNVFTLLSLSQTDSIFLRKVKNASSQTTTAIKIISINNSLIYEFELRVLKQYLYVYYEGIKTVVCSVWNDF